MKNFEGEFLGVLDEPFASRVNIIGGSSMVGSHVDGNDTEKDPKTGIMKDQLVTLEKDC
jgi:hypothetical protein